MDGIPHHPRFDESSIHVQGPGYEACIQVGDAVPKAQLNIKCPLGIQADNIANDIDGSASMRLLEQVMPT